MLDVGLLALVLGVLVVGLAVLIVMGASQMKRSTGLPAGRVLQSDVEMGAPGKPLYSHRYGLSGTPDYLVETAQGIVPVELKPARQESAPRDSHLLQVLAYCLLIEEEHGKAPPYGLLRYRNDTFRVDYNPQTRAYLLNVIDEMRTAARSSEVARSHEIPARCKRCSYLAVCDEALVPER